MEGVAAILRGERVEGGYFLTRKHLRRGLLDLCQRPHLLNIHSHLVLCDRAKGKALGVCEVEEKWRLDLGARKAWFAMGPRRYDE